MSSSQSFEDLRWVVEGPSFVTGPEAVGPGVLPTGVDVEHLDAFLDERASHRVGRYFEALVEYWLRHVRNLEMIGCGVQIRDGKRTIGEVDFLFRDESGTVTHWEAAVKFFLHHPNDHTSHFPGPNASDNFEHKVTKLLGQQLNASKIHFPEVTQRACFARGQVFYHPSIGRPANLPGRMPEQHRTGGWLRTTELDLLSARPGWAHIVEKPHWLAPQLAAELQPLAEFTDTLRSHFMTKDHPLMVSVRDQTGTETDRLFVVSERWNSAT